MAFTTQSCRNNKLFGWSRWLAALALGFASLLAQAGGFEVRSAATHLEDEHYQLTAHIDYEFSSEVLKALANGVPLTLELEIKVELVRMWWTNKIVAKPGQRHQLTYHAFSGQYLLRNLHSNKLNIYPSLDSALNDLGVITGLRLLPAGKVEDDRDYVVQVRTLLDIEALPTPLRPVAYVNPAWHLSSEWFTCPLAP